jgi:hypothetical protein
MFDRFARSWELVKASWNVLLSDKELLIFPLISMIGAVLVSILFAIPFFTVGVTQTVRGSEDLPVNIAGYVLLFIYYVVLYTVIFFCNTALVGAAMIRLNGGDPKVSDGIEIATKRLNHIIGYALISATVGVILRALSERGGLLGQIAASFVGMAWNIATFLVVPVLVIEDIGPIDAVKRSGSLLKKTWGEQLVGNLGMGAVFGLAFFLLFIVFFGLFAAAITTESGVAIAVVVIAAVACFVLLGLISSALEGIYQAAVYRHAMGEDVSGFFDPEMVASAFKPKRA